MQIAKKKNKFIWLFVAIIIVIVIFIGFKIFAKQDSSQTKYTIGSVTKDNITNFLSSTGQVYVSNEYSIKSKVSSTVTDVLKKKGDVVKKGDIVIKLDSSDLTKQLRSAEISLANAKNSYDKAVAPVDALSLVQAQSSLQNAKDNLEKLKNTQATALSQAEKNKSDAEKSLDDSYSSALNSMDTSFSNLSTIVNDLRKILYLSDNLLPQDGTSEDSVLIDMNNFWNVEMPSYWSDIINSTSFDSTSDKDAFVNLVKRATASYKNAKTSYDKNVITYRTLSKYSNVSDIESFLDSSISTNQYVMESLRDLNNVYNYWIDYNTQRHRTYFYSINTYNNTLKTHTNSVSSYITSLNNAKNGSNGILTIKNNIENYTNTLNTLKKTQPMDMVSSTNSLKIQEESYKKLNEGITDLEKKTYQLSISQAQANLADIQESIADYVIRSPFDGVVAKMDISIGDEVASSTSMATIISKQSIAQLTFNEVDIAKIKTGQRVTLTFDAIDDLTITGSVIDVDSIGTVSSGVVSYAVKISFDTEDSRIKPGMSVTANIILENKVGVLIAPNSAIKTSGESSYVEVFENNSKAVSGYVIESSATPTKKNIQTGLSDDSNTEILSGLNEGDLIVVKTTKATSTSKANGTSLLQNTNKTGTSTRSSSSGGMSAPPMGGF